MVRDGGCLTDEDGDGVLVLRALDADVGGLDERGLELGLRLGDVALDGDAAIVAIGGDTEGIARTARRCH